MADQAKRIADIIDSLVTQTAAPQASGTKTAGRSVAGVDEFVGVFDHTVAARHDHPVTDGLICYMTFDRESAQTDALYRDAADSTRLYGTTSGQDITARLVPGRVRDAYFGDSTADIIVAPQDESYEADLQLTTFTVEMWAYLHAWAGTSFARFVVNVSGMSSLNGHGLVISTDRRISALTYTSTTSGTGLTTGVGAMPIDEWTHILYTQRSDTDRELFVNGVSVSTGSSTAVPYTHASGSRIRLHYPQAVGSSMSIDEFRVYNRGFTAKEAEANYSALHPCIVGNMVMGECLVS